jgi:hypothetical protein
MKLIYYVADMPNGNKATHYLNLDRVDCFSVSDNGDVTTLYAMIGGTPHMLNNTKKILDVSKLMTRLQDLVDRSRVNISEFIEDTNNMVTTSQKKRR